MWDTQAAIAHLNSRAIRFPLPRLCRMLLILLSFSLLCVSHAVSAQTGTQVPNRSPNLVATEFYGWYLESLASDADPLTSKRAQLATYVSKALLADIDRQRRSPDGMPEDYFLKAQDYLDDWRSHRESSQPIRSRTSRVVIVTLGGAPQSKRSLELTMVSENAAWKIRKVKLLPAKPNT